MRVLCKQDALNRLVPEKIKYRHNAEGPDDMPAHVRKPNAELLLIVAAISNKQIKSSLFGASLTIPVTNGRLNLGARRCELICTIIRAVCRHLARNLAVRAS